MVVKTYCGHMLYDTIKSRRLEPNHLHSRKGLSYDSGGKKMRALCKLGFFIQSP